MRQIITMLFFLSSTLLFSQNEIEKITIPAGVAYKYCDPSIVAKAKQLITEDLQDSTKYSLSQSMLIVGPVLWRRFKEVPSIQKIEKGNVDFHFNDQMLKGKMAQSVKDSKTIWKAFRDDVNQEPFIIRKLNEKELGYYWAIISFDIDEPLLIVETKKHRYILNILKKDMKLMWLDEAP